ncbi:MAG: type II toxin-antitoxin system ParD family antitoxin [Alphaproteobacteria bacterium]|nr:type II toxin-antitoxin system ParD family antitoxin [Alphaproteobacteria bacterium]MDP6563461.1 type II toxin-antitoxin system ParD family antitoxin [Alphaproteobacteria bacterium]
MTVKSSISLTDQQDAFARTLVREGRYASVSAVIQQGLDLLRRQTEAEHAETEALRVLVEQRRAGGFLTTDQAKDRVDRMLERKRREHGLDN